MRARETTSVSTNHLSLFVFMSPFYSGVFLYYVLLLVPRPTTFKDFVYMLITRFSIVNFIQVEHLRIGFHSTDSVLFYVLCDVCGELGICSRS